ncbi:30S ribosomal protein S21 [Candidatus Xenohaliotis californiensis]|uniref:Small ribosomal subunit protein bS21 n=1 Tax=Candidatus Xenohaliotis californiensis TaxID=84677 RepID=A0ABM9N7X2_9RICK|nr:30S ribosomal protein S21 [Candidatus Xenohaliotis californiensis]
MVTVFVHNKNIEQALKWLQRKIQREGVLREIKMRRAYEKPSEKKARKSADSTRRRRKFEKKKMNSGY